MADNNNGFIIDAEHLYGKLEETNKTINQILTELNNGLKSEVKRNTKSIEKLTEQFKDETKRIEEKTKKIDAMKERKEGRCQVGNKIVKWGGWAVAILSLIIAAIRTGVI